MNTNEMIEPTQYTLTAASYFLRPFAPNPTNAKYTLKMLEDQIADLRRYGAPDDAEVIRGNQWAYFEIQWIGERGDVR